MEYKDYYKTLGVERNASEKEVKQAYRKLARQYHPDVNPGDKAAEARFQEINEAYEVLSDSENRKKYDTLGAYWKQAGSGARPGAGGPRPGGFEFNLDDLGDLFGGGGAAGGAGSGFSSFFERFFGSGGRRASSPGPGAARPTPTATADIEITLEEAFRGTSRTLELGGQQSCPMCGGVGVGSQGVCPRCRGTGQEAQARRLEVKIPAGVTEGSKVKAADVLLTVHLRNHPDYEVKGRDLIRKQPISLYEAMLGGEVSFSTLKGQEVTLKIPPETQNGKSFRIAGQGLPGSGSKAAGNLYVQVDVQLPTNLSARERELFEELSRLRSGRSGT